MSPDIQPLLLPRSYRSALFQSDPRKARRQPGCNEDQAGAVPCTSGSPHRVSVLRAPFKFLARRGVHFVTQRNFTQNGCATSSPRFRSAMKTGSTIFAGAQRSDDGDATEVTRCVGCATRIGSIGRFHAAFCGSAHNSHAKKKRLIETE